MNQLIEHLCFDIKTVMFLCLLIGIVGEEKEKKSWCFPEEKAEAFQYSSSIFYGAQDVYSQPRNPDPATTVRLFMISSNTADKTTQ